VAWHWHSALLFWPILGWILGSIPAFVIGRRLGVIHPGEAFIPAVGSSIVLLHSIRRSGWLCLLGLIPLVSLVFFIWLACVIPGEHGRTKWWILGFLIPGVNIVAYYVYAFTTADRTSESPPVYAA
jgi:AhpC/TSA family